MKLQATKNNLEELLSQYVSPKAIVCRRYDMSGTKANEPKPITKLEFAAVASSGNEVEFFEISMSEGEPFDREDLEFYFTLPAFAA